MSQLYNYYSKYCVIYFLSKNKISFPHNFRDKKSCRQCNATDFFRLVWRRTREIQFYWNRRRACQAAASRLNSIRKSKKFWKNILISFLISVFGQWFLCNCKQIFSVFFINLCFSLCLFFFSFWRRGVLFNKWCFWFEG